MEKILPVLFVFVALFHVSSSQATATTPIARSSAKLVRNTSIKVDNRAQILGKFLEERNSPLAPHAKTFVDEADRYSLDWKLVVAISGNESQFGLLIPENSYNGWGYGVYGNNVRRFSSWDEGISVVSNALREDYYNKWGATNIYEIGNIYAEDPMWANKVTYYFSEIEQYESKMANASISISL